MSCARPASRYAPGRTPTRTDPRRAPGLRGAAGGAPAPAGPPPRMHVNLSVAELHDPGFVDRIQGAIAEAGIGPSNLVLEITETQLLGDPPTSARRLALLREFGVQIALDDFGTGYSSLSYLHSLPLD